MDLPEPKLPNTALTPGDLLQDRYRVEDVLGSGGFAVVYAAHDTFMDRPVALKVLNTLGLAHRPQELRRIIERFRIGPRYKQWAWGIMTDLQQSGNGAWQYTQNAGGFLRYDF